MRAQKGILDIGSSAIYILIWRFLVGFIEFIADRKA